MATTQHQMYVRAARFAIDRGHGDHVAALFIDKLCAEGKLGSTDTFADVLNRLIGEKG